MLSKILIANRGEIACRVASTARRMGISTVAVYSDVDATARHVQMCDEAYHIGPAPARESYLRGDAIIAAALLSGAQAIHPGYGFLSENEEFAAAVQKAGLIFIGPPASAIAAMGNKSAAKALMQTAGVPLVPGYHGQDQDTAHLREEAKRVGYPVLIKASSGGGGKGMRIVTEDADFEAALVSCQREARASFGDEHVLIERYLQKPRHIEIQVFADAHGGCLYLFERDCSVQRRHQKVLEEAPAPGMDSARREAMGQAAVAAARAVGYVGAGTVEFIANQDGSFFFMEMNTRLQVEHPVTELITGFDLVEWQLRIAFGEPLPVSQGDLKIAGHALEARIYAENPLKDFLPATGKLELLRFPKVLEFSLPDAGYGSSSFVRIDSGVREGDTISPFYDPMIAKLIVWGADRTKALAAMREALLGCRIAGVVTNVSFLIRLIDNADFASATLDTGLIERSRDTLLAPAPAPGRATLALASAYLLSRSVTRSKSDPWDSFAAFRLNAPSRRSFVFDQDGIEITATSTSTADGSILVMQEHRAAFTFSLAPGTSQRRSSKYAALSVTLDGVTSHGEVTQSGDTLVVLEHAKSTTMKIVNPLAQAAAGEAEVGRLTAPMPGKVVAILATVGAKVQRGAPLLVMEAMKMEHTIAAPADGVVTELLYAVGDQVNDGAQLLVLDVIGTP